MPQVSFNNLNTSACKCSDCKTAFCRAKRNHETKCPCNDCKNQSYNTSVFYFGESHQQTTRAEVMSQGTDAVGSSALQKAPTPINEYGELDENSTELLSKTFSRQSSSSVPEVNDSVDDSYISEVHKVAVKNMSTTAQLSAQIMNLSYKDFKDTLSRDKPGKVYYNTNDILKRIKEAYDACTCKICECIIGKSALSRAEPCNCEPCNCKDCVSFRIGDLRNVDIDPRVRYTSKTDKKLEQIEGALESTNCSCQPCDCINCAKITIARPCDCEPCQCVDCKSMAIRNKTVIVAPAGEGTQQRANCLCAPCDCARCTHRGLNLSPNRVNEMSTGINRHPNCRCEACVDEDCEPNGTDSCRCQGRQGIIRKPVERNPNDFDIRRTTVSNNPINFHEGRFKTISMFSTINNNKYPQQNKLKPIEKECKCSICECIVCKCKGNDMSNSKISQNTDKIIRTLKLPRIDSSVCKCWPCDCEYCCSDKSQGQFSEIIEFKSCTCEICDCIQCDGVAKPTNAFSRIIPVTETWTRKKCECRPCECNDCRKQARDGEVCHCDICRCERCTHKGNASEEALYPIKKGELLTPSLLHRDPLSEPEILSQISDYTELKHSKGQSNVFKRESRAPVRSKQNFTIFHMVPETNIIQSSFEPTKSVQPAMKLNKLDSITERNKVRRLHVLDKAETDNDVTQFYSASTSKNSPPGVRVETQASNGSCSNELKSTITACLHDTMAASSSYRSLTPSVLSILSTHNFLNLSPCLSNNKKSCQLTISSPERKAKHLDELDKTCRIGSFGTCLNNEKQCGYQIFSRCGKRYFKNDFNRLINNKVTQTPQDETNQDDDSLLNHPLVKYLLSNHSNFNQDSIVSNDSHQKSTDNKIEHSDCHKNNMNAWRFGHSNRRSFSTNTFDVRLPNKYVPYKSALVTLQKAKEFSLELVKLLEQYEKANLEFESIAKKLKKSHESILNAFKNEVFARPNEDTGSELEGYGIEQPNNNLDQTLDCNIKKSSRSFSDGRSLVCITENPKKSFSDNKRILSEPNHFDRLGLNNKNHVNMNHNDALKSEHSKKIVGSDCKNVVTEDSESSTTDILRLVDGKVKIDKETQNMKLPANYYKVYRKLIRRSAYIARKFSQKNSSPSESKTGSICLPMSVRNTEIVKEMIKQETHVIMKEFKSPTAEDTKASSVVQKGSPIDIKEIKSFAEESRSTLNSKSQETKAKTKAQGYIKSLPAFEVKEAEKNRSTVNRSAMDERPSYASNKALENLQNEVKELLNMPGLQCHSIQDDRMSETETLIKPVKEIQVKDAWNSSSWSTQNLPISHVDYDFNKGGNAEQAPKIELEEPQRQKKDFTIPTTLKVHSSSRNAWINSKVSHKSQESKSSCDSMKVGFLGVRRVSDHTVMVKWEKPKGSQDIHGYEILVDGRAVQKIFSPSRCMAVVTCLPHVERILLTIRTITKALNKSGSYPCSTIVYRPRAK